MDSHTYGFDLHQQFAVIDPWHRHADQIAGAIQAVLWLLHAGALTRFVSFSMMTGFIMGIGVVTILSQLPNAHGLRPRGWEPRLPGD